MRRSVPRASAMLCALLGGIAFPAAAAVTPAGAAQDSTEIRNAVVEQPVAFSADDLLLVEVDSDGYQLADSFGVFSSRSGIFIPLEAIARLLDLAITVDADHGYATGWILSQGRTLRLDVNAGQAAVNGRTVSFTRAQAVVYEGDIYVRADLAEQLLPIKLKAQLHDLVLTVVPTEKLPFQERAAREQAKKALGFRGPEEQVVRVRTPYEWFTPPAIDLNLALAAGNRSPQTAERYDLRLAGDLLHAGFQLFAGSDDTGHLDDLRVLFERKDPYRRDAGLRGLTRLSVGDTFTPNLSIGPGSVGGRGIAFTSASLEQASVFDTTDIRGELPQNWQVELYVNEVLQGAQDQPADGRYEFKAIHLAYGLNTLRLVFYGPRGERREEVRRVNVGAGLLTRGEIAVSFGAVQTGVPVFDVRPRIQPLDPTGGVAPVVLPGEGQWRVTGQAAYGLTPTTTLSAGFASYTPVVGEKRNLAEVGLVTSAFGFAAQLAAAGDSAGGGAVSVGLAGRPAGVSVVLRDTEYTGGFVDEAQTVGTGVSRDTNLTLDYAARLGALGVLPISLRAVRDQFVDGASRLTAGAQVSKPLGRYLVSSALTYQTSSSPAGGSAPAQLTGAFDVSALVRGAWQLRGGTAFTTMPNLRVDSVFVTADRSVGDRMAVRFGLTHSFDQDGSTIVQATNTWRLNAADLSIGGSYATRNRDLRLVFNVSVGFGYDPLAHRYRSVGPGAASGGAMEVQAFVDANGDGVRQPSEAGVPGILVQGGRRPAVTDARGDAIVVALGSGATSRARLDTEKVDDPYLTGPPPVLEIVPRPGRLAIAPYPMTATGEIEIKARFRRAGEAPRGLSALALQLVNAAGVVVAQGRTEFDGSLLLEGLRPGSYDLRIEPEQGQRLHMALLAPVKITIGRAGGFAGHVEAEMIVQAPEKDQTSHTP